MDWQLLSQQVKSGETAAIARAISLVENNISGCSQLLESLQLHPIPVVGITGPPGAGKSTFIEALGTLLTQLDRKVAVLVCRA